MPARARGQFASRMLPRPIVLLSVLACCCLWAVAAQPRSFGGAGGDSAAVVVKPCVGVGCLGLRAARADEGVGVTGDSEVAGEEDDEEDEEVDEGDETAVEEGNLRGVKC